MRNREQHPDDTTGNQAQWNLTERRQKHRRKKILDSGVLLIENAPGSADPLGRGGVMEERSEWRSEKLNSSTVFPCPYCDHDGLASSPPGHPHRQAGKQTPRPLQWIEVNIRPARRDT